MKFAKNIGIIHFIGIGGIGMSAIANLLHDIGYTLQGSDIANNSNVARLEKLGIKIYLEHFSKNVENAKLVVYSSAIKKDNPEYLTALKNNIPLIKRAEMLAELMRFKYSIAISGTHGKTTTTSIIGCILVEAQYDPTIINGGIINQFGSNTRIGKSDWIVAEADESDGSFTRLSAEIAVVTNIDREHVDYYKTFNQCKKDFKHFVNNVPFYGCAVLCIDDKNVYKIYQQMTEKKIITYGFAKKAQYSIKAYQYEQEGSRFSVEIKNKNNTKIELQEFFLPMHGKHNALNATAAIAVCRQIGIKINVIKKAIAQFQGVKRRFTHIENVKGIQIYDDYAHHPSEITAVLKATRKIAQEKKNRIVAVVQPHRFSRLNALLKQFSRSFKHADAVIVMPVYPAGEKNITGVDHHKLACAIEEQGHKNVKALNDKPQDNILKHIADETKKNDIVIFLGAGSITKYANQFPQYLKGK